MSDLGEISAELNEALGRLERLLAQLSELDRRSLAPLQAELSRLPDGRRAAALIDRARQLLRQASEGTVAARRAGAGWLSRHGSSQVGGSHGFDTPGGRAYYPPMESNLRELAAVLPEFPGEYTFDAHGSDEHVFIGEETLSAQEVAELIEADERWGRRPVRLFSCDTGLGEAPIAEQLAKILKVKVTAPEGRAWSSADGRHGVFPIETKLVQGVVVEGPNYKAEGRWREFDPD
ncbi:MAG TPA: hypothetical protein VFK14_03085 [Solirubrobacterales bacterium]|nr:hypothetical protein [Solirubrobacterales bacterium]